MSALRDFQSDFRSFLTGTARPDADAMLVRIFGTAYAANAGIYRNNVRHAHSGALAAIFPAVRALVGETYFDGLAAQFADRFPPRGAILAEYGAAFPHYLTERPELSHVPFLPGVARLEWAMNDAFHAHSAFSLTPEDAVVLFNDDDARLRPLPSVRLVTASVAVHVIHRAALAGDADGIERADQGKQHLLVYRPDRHVTVEPLPAGEFILLDCLAAGDTVDTAIASATAGDRVFSPAEAIGRLLHLGVFMAPNPTCEGH